MRFLGRGLIGLFMLAATLGILAVAGHGLWSAFQVRWAEQAAPGIVRERVFAANMIPVTMGTVTPEMELFGEIRARRTLELRAPRGGTVIELAEGFEDGGFVGAGTVLMRLDPADAIAARDLAANDLARAEAEVRDAARGLALSRDELVAAEAQASLRDQAVARQQTLLDRGVGSEAARETAALAAASADQAALSRRMAVASAEARVDQADSALARARITLSEAERILRDTELSAEFDGVLADVAVVSGGIVSPNERIARLIDPDALEVAFRVSNAQYSRLLDSAGRLIPAPVEVALDVTGTEIATTGTLARASGAVGEGQTGRLLYAALAAPRGFLPGDFVTLRLAEPELTGVAMLPATALGTGDTVLALGPEDRLEPVPVTVLRRQGDRVIVSAPEALEGREIVAERSPLLGAGIKVRPMRQPGAEAAAAPALPDLIRLTPQHRAALVALVEANGRMPAEARSRILAQLAQDEVPAGIIARIEQRTGG
ncbi:MAG: HlyD family efflux transporter periplasmic adaptor subunit [Gemmobacter sp.]